MKRGKRVLGMALAALLLAAAPAASALAAPAAAASGAPVSYLTGLPVAAGQQNQRPIAVMLNNIKSGCPQSGIAEASVVYEAPVEGRITRLMGLYENWSSIENIGYVRSSRDYFVYCALEHDAIYCHYGQATPYVGDLLNSPRVDNVSGAVSGIHVPAQTAYSRTGKRKAPHNVLASGSGILKDVQRLGYSQTYHQTFQPKFVFMQPSELGRYAAYPAVTQIYPGGTTANKTNGYSRVQARFVYENGKYYRYQYGKKQVDEKTGQQIAYDNVILQYCNGEVRDKNDYLAFGCHGDVGAPVQVFTQGKAISGTWTRHADGDPAIYVDQTGQRIKLTPGKTWICLVWNDYAGDVVLK